MHLGMQMWLRQPAEPSIRMGKKGDLSDFEHGMVVGARPAGLSISETVDLLGFSRTTISYSNNHLLQPRNAEHHL